MVKLVKDKVLIAATRKTHWGMIDKKACAVGGALTHRLALNDAVLIKDNHLALIDHDFEKIFYKIRNAKTPGRFIELEITSLSDAKKVIFYYKKFTSKFPFYLMLDNMKPALIRKVIQYVKNAGLYNCILFEASGGINKENIFNYAKSGVDLLSLGMLTHSSPALDISLEFEL
jgi:nicotinate-nucleotide pyrophosphorylase (carboxylating)